MPIANPNSASLRSVIIVCLIAQPSEKRRVSVLDGCGELRQGNGTEPVDEALDLLLAQPFDEGCLIEPGFVRVTAPALVPVENAHAVQSGKHRHHRGVGDPLAGRPCSFTRASTPETFDGESSHSARMTWYSRGPSSPSALWWSAPSLLPASSVGATGGIPLCTAVSSLWSPARPNGQREVRQDRHSLGFWRIVR